MHDVNDSNEKKKKKEEMDEEVKRDLDEILHQLSESEKSKKEAQEEKKESAEPKSEPAPEEEKESPGASVEEELQDILEQISEEEPPPAELSALDRLVGIFLKPRQVFEYLRVKPDIWLPLILIALISIGVSFSVYDIALDQQIEKIEQNERIPDEQKNLILDKIEASRSGAKKILSSAVVAPLSTVIVSLVVAGFFFFLGNIILGGKASFAQIFSVYLYAQLIPTILGSIVKIPLWVSQQSLGATTSLAVLLPTDMSGSTVARLLGNFDIFTIWYLIVFSMGFAIIYRFSQLKSYLAVFISWFLFIIIKVGLGSIFSSFMG